MDLLQNRLFLGTPVLKPIVFEPFLSSPRAPRSNKHLQLLHLHPDPHLLNGWSVKILPSPYTNIYHTPWSPLFTDILSPPHNISVKVIPAMPPASRVISNIFPFAWPMQKWRGGQKELMLPRELLGFLVFPLSIFHNFWRTIQMLIHRHIVTKCLSSSRTILSFP